MQETKTYPGLPNKDMSMYVDTLKKYFQFDRIFILYHYYYDLEKLYNDLAELKRDSYDPNYRFIFLHYETEYYISIDRPGIVLTNLQRILHHLGISNYFCLVISQQQLDKQLKWLQKNETNDLTCIDSLVYHDFYCVTEDLVDQDIIDNLDINVDAINSKYISLNQIKRHHRRMLFGLLKERNLLDHGKVSYGKKPGI